MFRIFFSTLPRNFARVFAPRYLGWHLLAVVLTYFLVTLGFDWWYYVHTRTEHLLGLTLPAAIAGFFVPLLLPVGMFVSAQWRNSQYLLRASVAVAQAEALGWIVSSLYKAFTGRVQPDFLVHTHLTDISRDFNFGFLQHGIFWGWPSSHTAVAWAGMAALIYMYPKNRPLVLVCALYALYIGLGVSISIHWFSDFAAGAIFGVLIGVVVARQMQRSQTPRY